MLRDNTYITIQSFMINELNLKGNELIVYAIIYGFSQDSKSAYYGGVQYLADWCNVSRQAVSKILSTLVTGGLIKRSEVRNAGVTYSSFSVVDRTEIETQKQKVEKQSAEREERMKANQSEPTELTFPEMKEVETIEVEDYSEPAAPNKPKKMKKIPKELKGEDDKSRVKAHYKLNVKTLHSRGKLLTENCSVNNPVINKRLGRILHEHSVEVVNTILDKAMNDDWVVKNGYSLQVILSDTVFYKVMNKPDVTPTVTRQSTFEDKQRNYSDTESWRNS